MIEVNLVDWHPLAIGKPRYCSVVPQEKNCWFLNIQSLQNNNINKV
jgi:hypothetical protein